MTVNGDIQLLSHFSRAQIAQTLEAKQTGLRL